MVVAAMKGTATATTTTTTDPITTTITTTTTTGPITTTTTIGPFTTTGPTGPIGPTGPTLGESSRECLGAFSTVAGHSTNPERETSHPPPKMESTSDNK